MKLVCSKASPPLGGIICAYHIFQVKNVPLEITWADETAVDGFVCRSSNDVARFLSRIYSIELYGNTALELTEVDSWLTFSLGLSTTNNLQSNLQYLNRALAPVTFLANKRLTIADFCVYAVIRSINQLHDVLQKHSFNNILRWYNFLDSQKSVKDALSSIPIDVQKILEQGIMRNYNRYSTEKTILTEKTASGRAKEGKFVDLPGAEMGKVIVRFPPEASGYLHIGHAKAALLNQYYQEAFNGKLIMRFDDTNPAKENTEFEKVILEDVKMLEIKPDMFTHTSQYFDLMLEYSEKLIKENKAYVDDTDAELMKQQREQKVESVNRNNSVETNLRLWEEMKKGSEIGQRCCVRAKIDMQSANGCMRDPTIYRCKNEVHPRTGDKYKVYPTYDFACPIVDSIEGVTHVLRTMEYHDRDPQFFWFIDALGLRKPHIWEYSRLSMTNTVLSKRKLTWFVNEGLVDGWDDPRMPTVRGVLRRGMTVQGLKEFIIAQGSSRSVVFMEWDKIWSFNKKVIDPIAPRYTALDFSDPVPVIVENVKEECLTVPLHPKNAEIGTKEVWIGSKVLIDRADAELLKANENATFINWGNLMIKKINRQNGKVSSVEAETNLDNKNYKNTLKLTWLAETSHAEFTPTWCVYFDHIISKPVLGKDEDFKKYIGHETRREAQMIGDPELRKLKKGDIIQLQRRGFFKVDVAYAPKSIHTCKEQPIILFHVPDGHAKENMFGVLSSSNTVKVTEDKKQSEENLNEQIMKQGNLVRDLKKQNAAKADIDANVKVLLDLKAQYKALTKRDWQPVKGTAISTAQKDSNARKDITDNEATLLQKIAMQGDKVRDLKSKNAKKALIDDEVKILLNLKKDYKNLTGSDWKPGIGATKASPRSIEPTQMEMDFSVSESSLLSEISAQGDKVRQLKAEKAEKSIVDAEVKTLLKLKADFATLTGKTWQPGMKAETNVSVDVKLPKDNLAISELTEKITSKGNIVRELKAKKALKEEIEAEVKILLELKTEYKRLTGTDFPSTVKTPSKVKESKNVKIKEPKQKEKLEKTSVTCVERGPKKQTRLGLEAKKSENLSDWYSQVITKGELIEYYDVSGCYIFRPWSFAIWEEIRNWFDNEIKKLGVQNCYFPMFVSKSVLEKEKTHIADFAPEVAWVTKSGNSEMAEPIAVRPTSETVMYPAYAKWIQSYRDLPIKLNQWNNVVRWEFKHPQPFLRTREFLWQEGHTAYADKEEACEEVGVILDLYARVYTDLLAIPVIKGKKTEKEKFAGGEYTYTVEAFISASGRGIQGATSHHLGQNFSKMFDIVYEDPETQEKKYVYQNSWGFTTRTIGVLIMVHADDQGLVLPPRVASIQIIIIPCGITAGLSESARKQLQDSCNNLEADLTRSNLKVKGDYRANYSPGWKFNHWELKGVPIRIELGPKDIEKDQIVVVRRDTGEKLFIPRKEAVQKLSQLLDTVQKDLYEKACKELESHKVLLANWSDFTPHLDKKNIILAPFCGNIDCEDKIKADSTRDDDGVDSGAPSMGAKSLCIPLDQPTDIKPTDKCIHPDCKNKPKFYALFGRSY